MEWRKERRGRKGREGESRGTGVRGGWWSKVWGQREGVEVRVEREETDREREEVRVTSGKTGCHPLRTL